MLVAKDRFALSTRSSYFEVSVSYTTQTWSRVGELNRPFPYFHEFYFYSIRRPNVGLTRLILLKFWWDRQDLHTATFTLSSIHKHGRTIT